MRFPETKIMIFTMHKSDTLLSDPLQTGARAFVFNSEARHHLIRAIEALARNELFIGPSKKSTQTSPLTARERTVVQLAAAGYRNLEMAQLLNLSLKTIEAHRASAMRKLNITSTAALVRYAIRNKLTEL
jgi:DNA-binding NarL/FixJ family response regulator